MSFYLWPVVAIVFALAGVFARPSAKHAQWLNTAAWVVLGLGFVFLHFTEEVTLAAAAGVAALAGTASLRPFTEEDGRRRRILAFGAIVPVAVAVAALNGLDGATSPWSGQLVVYTAYAAALVAGVTNLTTAAAVVERRVSPSIALASLGAVGGLVIAGTGRSSLPDAFYGFPLRAGGEPLQWVLGPVPGFEGGIRLAVAVPVPTFFYGVLAIGGLWLAVFGLLAAGRKFTRHVYTALGFGTIGLTAAIAQIVSALSVPGGDAYEAEVKRRILAGGQNRVVDTGAFTATSDWTVDFSDIAPELVALTLLIGLAWAALFTFDHDAEPTEQDAATDRGFARDLMLRGVGFLWLSWFVLVIIHHGLLGAPGMGSPAEWTFVGALLGTTGVLLAVWRTEESIGRRAMRFAPGIALVLWFVLIGLSWRFGAFPGLSLGIL